MPRNKHSIKIIFGSSKNIFKKFYKLFKPYFVIALVFLFITLINTDKYGVNTKLYSVGYTLYGHSILFFKQLFENEIPEDNIKSLREKRYLEQKYESLLAENHFLKQQLNLVSHTHYKYINAWVTQITHPKGETTIVISAGSKDGVKIGNIVINEYGIVGRVSQTTEKFSVISLLGNENVKISAIILPSYQNCIVGKNINKDFINFKLSINYLNETSGINDGDSVISSGKDGITPFGLNIGIISKSDGKVFVMTKNHIFNTLIVQVAID